MIKILENPSAFACASDGGYQEGMSLRDYFAAHCPITFAEFLNDWESTHRPKLSEVMVSYAKFRFSYAEAMLTARRKVPMADIIPFQTEDAAFYRSFVRENLPERRTQEIIADLKGLRMLGDDDAVLRGVLFAELAVKAEMVSQ